MRFKMPVDTEVIREVANKHLDKFISALLLMCADEIDRLRSSEALKWEGDHQRRVLEQHGLEEEFAYFGCDAIDAVCEQLVHLRSKNHESV